MEEFSLLIHKVITHDHDTVQKLARRLGKRCSTLLREADPHDARAKMGADTLFAFMEVSHDVRPLAYMAGKLGLELRKIPES